MKRFFKKNSTFNENILQMIQIEKQHIFQQFFYRGVNEKEAVWWWKETKETNVKDGRVV
jgi:hypothetical protein